MKIIDGDLLTVTDGLIIHGCNSRGVMGSGIALQIRNRYPKAYAAYKTLPKGEESLGAFQAVYITNDLYIGNCITQLDFGSDGKKYASIQAIKKSLDSAFFWCTIFKKSLNSPEIGCGLGGLSWDNEVSKIFEVLSEKHPDVEVNIYRYKP